MPEERKYGGKTLKEIVEATLPNYQIVGEPEQDEDTGEAPVARSDAVAPGLAALRRKFGVAPEDEDEAPKWLRPEKGEVLTVVVEPKSAQDRAHGTGQKVLLVSREGKIIGMQG